MSELQEDRYQTILKGIEYERQEEEDYYISLAQNKSISEKIDSGILWYPVDMISHYYSIGEKIEINVERVKHLSTPHKLKTGMACLIFGRAGNENAFSAKGVISYVRRNKLGVMLNDSAITIDDLNHVKGNIGVEMTYDERPYKVMKKAIEKVINSEEPTVKSLREKIRTLDAFDYSVPANHVYVPEHLNPSQSTSLRGCIESQEFSIIHGPPGTGKTTTLVALIKELAKSEKKILVCAPSNNAVDLLAYQLDLINVPTLRVGNVTRIGDNLMHLTIAEKARMHPEWQHIKKVKIEAEEAKRLAGKRKRVFGQKERGNRKMMYQESRELRKWARDLEDKLMDKLISDSKVICTTLIGVSQRSIKDLHYSTLIIDEASQALEPECWNAMLRADRIILAGDHLQLAPTVKSMKAEKIGFSVTLLTRLADSLKHSYLLDTQYRMNDKILSFSNKKFYDSKLKSASGINSWTLEDDTEPLVMVDTSGSGFEETMNPKSLSRYNEGEYFILREHFILNQKKYQNISIGIISPYREQVKFLSNKIEEDEVFSSFEIEVNSIDGFQGQEKDVIYISLVRSNDRGEIGFLKDERRLNVAMTRARKKLIIIGDMSTLSQDELFNDLSQHIEKEGLYQSAWEYMSA
jgi:superfamily I DNA and/or RNA helicase